MSFESYLDEGRSVYNRPIDELLRGVSNAQYRRWIEHLYDSGLSSQQVADQVLQMERAGTISQRPPAAAPGALTGFEAPPSAVPTGPRPARPPEAARRRSERRPRVAGSVQQRPAVVPRGFAERPAGPRPTPPSQRTDLPTREELNRDINRNVAWRSPWGALGNLIRAPLAERGRALQGLVEEAVPALERGFGKIGGAATAIGGEALRHVASPIGTLRDPLAPFARLAAEIPRRAGVVDAAYPPPQLPPQVEESPLAAAVASVGREAEILPAMALTASLGALPRMAAGVAVEPLANLATARYGPAAGRLILGMAEGTAEAPIFTLATGHTDWQSMVQTAGVFTVLRGGHGYLAGAKFDRATTAALDAQWERVQTARKAAVRSGALVEVGAEPRVRSVVTDEQALDLGSLEAEVGGFMELFEQAESTGVARPTRPWAPGEPGPAGQQFLPGETGIGGVRLIPGEQLPAVARPQPTETRPIPTRRQQARTPALPGRRGPEALPRPAGSVAAARQALLEFMRQRETELAAQGQNRFWAPAERLGDQVRDATGVDVNAPVQGTELPAWVFALDELVQEGRVSPYWRQGGEGLPGYIEWGPRGTRPEAPPPRPNIPTPRDVTPPGLRTAAGGLPAPEPSPQLPPTRPRPILPRRAQRSTRDVAQEVWDVLRERSRTAEELAAQLELPVERVAATLEEMSQHLRSVIRLPGDRYRLSYGLTQPRTQPAAEPIAPASPPTGPEVSIPPAAARGAAPAPGPPPAPTPPPPEVGPVEAERRILAAMGPEATPIDTIIERSGLEPGRVSAELLMAELGGKVRRRPGNNYELVQPPAPEPTAPRPQATRQPTQEPAPAAEAPPEVSPQPRPPETRLEGEIQPGIGGPETPQAFWDRLAPEDRQQIGREIGLGPHYTAEWKGLPQHVRITIEEHYYDIVSQQGAPTSPPATPEMNMALARFPEGPNTALEGQAYTVTWAGGRGTASFRQRVDALNFTADPAREAVRVELGRPPKGARIHDTGDRIGASEPPTVTPPPAGAEAPADYPRVQFIETGRFNVDAPRFQFKGGTDAAGTSPLLRDVPRFDPYRGGVVLAWEDAEGKTWIVNGHHRLALARRSGAAGLNAIVLREADGFTAEEARGIGALMNIGEGRGTRLDAAKIFNDLGLTEDQLRLQGISLREPIVADGLALAQLEPAAMGRVVRGELPERYGVILGRELPRDAAGQIGALEMLGRLQRRRNVTPELFEETIRQVARGPRAQETTQTLFGEEVVEQSLAPERADLIVELRQRFTADKRMAGYVSKRAERLADIGTQVDVEAAEAARNASARLAEHFDTAARYNQSVRDIIDDGARRIHAREGRASEIAEDIYEDIARRIEADLQGQAGGRPRPDTEGGGPQPPARGGGGLFEPEEPAPRAGPVVAPEAPRAIAPTETAGRPPAPKTRDVIRQMEEVARAPIRTGRFRQRALGVAYRHTRVVRLRRTGDIDTAGHEVGHILDYSFGFTERARQAGRGTPLEAELLALGRVTSRPSYKKHRVIAEGVAEFTRLWLWDRATVAERAPTITGLFEKAIDANPELRTGLYRVRDSMRDWTEANPTDAFLTDVLNGQQARAERLPRRRILGPAGKVDAALFDEDLALERALELGGGHPALAREPLLTQRLMATRVAGRVQQALEDGWFDERGHRVAPSMREIESIVEASGRTVEEFDGYVMAKHALDLMDYGIELPWSRRPRSVIEAAIREWDSPQFREAAEQLQAFQHQLRQVLEQEAQIVRPGWAAAMEKRYRNYVPMISVMKDRGALRAGGGRGSADITSPVRRIFGGGESRLGSLSEIRRRTYLYLELAERCQLRRQLADWANATPEVGWLVEHVSPKLRGTRLTQGLADQLADRVRKALDPEGTTDLTTGQLSELMQDVTMWSQELRGGLGENVISVWRRGQIDLYQIHPELMPILTRANSAAYHWVVRLLSVPKDLVRNCSTLYSPQFMFLRNPARDFATRVLQSPGWDPLVTDMAGAVRDIALQRPQFEAMVRAGGAQVGGRGLTMDPDMGSAWTDPRRVGPKLRGTTGRVARAAGTPVRGVLGAGELLENLPRFRTFQAVLKQQLAREVPYARAVREAALAAREATVPFERGGWLTKPINRAIPFFNVQFQGPAAAYRAFKARPLETTLKGLTYITLPVMINYAMVQSVPEWRADWENLAAWRKYTGLNLPVGTDEKGETRFLWIPLPQEWGIVFGSAPIAAMERVRGQDPRAWGKFLEAAMSLNSPIEMGNWLNSILPAVIAPAAGASMNRDWLGRPIVPRRQQADSPRVQIGEQTSEVGRYLGPRLNFSGRKIDYLLNGYFGTVGRNANAVIDAVVARTGRGTRPSVADEEPFWRGVIHKASYNSDMRQDFYDDLDRLERLESEADAGIATMTDEEAGRLGAARRLASGTSRQWWSLSRIAAAKREIMSDELSPEEKRRQIDELVALETRLLCEFMEREVPPWAQLE
jgi:hypothetical protein